MALYRGYAETRVAGGPLRRFLLDFDISKLFPVPAVVNHLDLDGAGTPKRPDLAVQVIVHAIDTDRPAADGKPGFVDTHLEVRLEPEPDRDLRQVEVRVFIDMSGNVYDPPPAAGQPPPPPTPDPSQFVYLQYRGDAGQSMPAKLVLHLSSRKVRSGLLAADPLVQDDVDIVATTETSSVTGPLHLAGGQLEGTVSLGAAVATLYNTTTGVYTEQAPVDARIISLGAPTATIANLSVTTPGMPTFPLECLWVGIGTDHTSGTAARPSPAPAPPPNAPVPPGRPTAPVALLANAGAGNVNAGTHRYKVAYVLRNGKETKPSDASAAIAVANPATDGKVKLTNLPIGLSAVGTKDPDVEVVARRIYRTFASATGDDGEYRLVMEIPNNTDTETTTGNHDNKADVNLGEPPLDAMTVHVSSKLRHDVTGDLTLRGNGVEDRFDAELGLLPTDTRVIYTTRPGAGRPRVRWQADAVLDSVKLRLPKLNSGNYRWGEARGAQIPQFLGADWFVLGNQTFAVEIGGPQLGDPLASPLGHAEVLLASKELGFRTALQAVCVEHVTREHKDGTPPSARTRIAATDLMHARVAFGEAGPRHAHRGDGVTAQLQLGRNFPMTHMPKFLPPRALRFLLIDERYVPKASSSHLSVRAGDLPDSLELDLRMTDADPGPEYLGLHLSGEVARLKVLSLTTPSAGREAYDADDLRLWLTIPITPKDVDIKRADGDTFVVLPARTFAEASVRVPAGFDTSADPWRQVKAAVSLPGSARVGPGVVAYGTAGAGTTATTLVDPGVPFDATHSDAFVRYLTGPNVGIREAVTGVAAGASLTTAAFPNPPGVGDRYALEDRDGVAAETSILGPGIDARVALSKDLGGLVPTRATPQVRLHTIALPGAPQGTVPDPQMRSVTARVYGVRAASLAADAGGALSIPVILDASRVNKSLRANIRTREDPAGTTDRDLLKARIEIVPPEVLVDIDMSTQRFGVTLSEPSGPGAFWMEPQLVRGADAGPRMDQRAGIGLVQFEIDMIPRALRATILGPGAFPANFNPGAGFTGGGITAEVSEMASINFFRMIRWARDHRDDLNQIFWSRIDARFIRWNQDTPAVAPVPAMMTPVDIWMFGEADPADENKPHSGVGYRIPTPGVTLTLDADVYSKRVNLADVYWGALPGVWDLRQELQMSAYAGTVSLSTTTSGIAAGSEAAGPGTWFLRLVDGRDWNLLVGNGSAYFGNTGGWLGSRPRIFQ